MKKNGDELFIFCKYPNIVHLVKWKYDYLIFKKKKNNNSNNFWMLSQYHLKEFHPI